MTYKKHANTPRGVKPPLTWILVADGTQAQVYARTTREKKIPVGSGAIHRHYDESSVQDLTPVPGMMFRAESDTVYETGRDRLGRVQESATSARHMSEPSMDIHEEIKQHFMKMLATRLNEACAKKSFGQLVVIAPPKMLGELREYLSAAVTQCIAAELHKDFTKYGSAELTERLKEIV